MSLYGTIQQQPRHYDMFAVVRMLERDNPALPRLGENAVLRDEFLRLSQNPYFAFPAANLEGFERTENGWRMTVRFLGQFGPQGSLPLALSEEAYAWLLRNDTSFPRFVEVISSRFLALFFRAWANARPIAQHDRPESDRFLTYIGAQIGIGSPTLRNRDSVEDERKLALAGVIGAKAKSASRLRSFLGGLFGLKVEVEEFIGSQLALNPEDRTRLGAAQSTLGGDIVLGSSVFSVQDKIRIRVFARDLAQYMDFLPSGSRCVELVDKYQPHVFWFDWWIEQIVFAPYLQRFAAHYYNRAREWGDTATGYSGVVINYKHQAFPDKTAVLDIERGQLTDIRYPLWQTDTAVAKHSWGYVKDQDYKATGDIIGDLIDIVSKNGVLLLNIGPAPDGTIPDPEQRILLEIGDWLAVNGEAIYGTRPWKRYGEGPTQVVAGSFNDVKRPSFSAQDIRFTTKGDTLYAHVLALPREPVVIHSLSGAPNIRRVTLLGSSESVQWSHSEAGLVIQPPGKPPCHHACVFKLE